MSFDASEANRPLLSAVELCKVGDIVVMYLLHTNLYGMAMYLSLEWASCSVAFGDSMKTNSEKYMWVALVRCDYQSYEYRK